MHLKNILAYMALGLMSLSLQAMSRPKTYFYYNVTSAGTLMTDAQCQVLMSDRDHYPANLVLEGKDPERYKKIDYIQTNITKINKSLSLITSYSNGSFTFNGKVHNVTNELAFITDASEEIMQGSFLIPKYCKGNIIGVYIDKNV